jgi:Ca2+-transporting ATPase
MLGRPQWTRILWVGALEASLVLGVFMTRLGTGDLAMARSLAFSTLVFCELFRAFAARSRKLVYWQVGAFTNLPLIAVVALSALVQVSIDHLAFARSFFRIEEMSSADTLLCLGVGLIPVTVLEVGKLLARFRR